MSAMPTRRTVLQVVAASIGVIGSAGGAATLASAAPASHFDPSRATVVTPQPNTDIRWAAELPARTSKPIFLNVPDEDGTFTLAPPGWVATTRGTRPPVVVAAGWACA